MNELTVSDDSTELRTLVIEDDRTAELSAVVVDETLKTWDELTERDLAEKHFADRSVTGTLPYNSAVIDMHPCMGSLNAIGVGDDPSHVPKAESVEALADDLGKINQILNEASAPVEEARELAELLREAREVAAFLSSDDEEDTEPRFEEDRIPPEACRGDTPEDAYREVYKAQNGDRVLLKVEAESAGQIEGCNDRTETWVGVVGHHTYGSRQNVHSLSGGFRRFGGDEEGRGRVTHHTNKSSVRAFPSTSGNSHGSPLKFKAPISILEDDRHRTVVRFEVI